MASIAACPRCSVPVTFGGGRTIEKDSASLLIIPFLIKISGLKKPLSSQSLYIRSSVSFGLYGFKNFIGIDFSKIAIEMCQEKVPSFTFIESDLNTIDYSNYKLIPYTTIDYIKNPFYVPGDTTITPLTTPSPPYTITSDSNAIKANNADIIPCTITSNSVKDAIKV